MREPALFHNACMSRVLTLILLIASATPALGEDRYRVRFEEQPLAVEVQACFAGEAPARLYRHRRAQAHAEWIRWQGNPLAPRGGRDQLELPRLPPGACVEWRVDLAGAVEAGDYRLAMRSGEAVITATSLWFWKGPWQRAQRVAVELPPGWSFSTPWPALEDEPGRVYRPQPTSSSWSSRTAVGRFPLRRVDLPRARIALAVTGGLPGAEVDKLHRWIRRSLESVSGVFGHFPQPSLQVLVVPIGRQSRPVPWAHVIRGGGPAVELFVDPGRSLAALDADWTATHEFSHLLLPHVASRDRWLSEGLASYYQNVLRARDGRLSEAEAWQKLHAGFRRGAAGTRGGTLAEATRSGRGATMRVYWSGAAMMLQADARLRAATGGRQSLDSALQALHHCCREERRSWRARDLLERLDRLTGTTVFGTTYRENVHSRGFPDLAETYELLGLQADAGSIGFDDAAPLAGVRRDIMMPAGGG